MVRTSKRRAIINDDSSDDEPILVPSPVKTPVVVDMISDSATESDEDKIQSVKKKSTSKSKTIVKDSESESESECEFDVDVSINKYSSPVKKKISEKSSPLDGGKLGNSMVQRKRPSRACAFKKLNSLSSSEGDRYANNDSDSSDTDYQIPFPTDTGSRRSQRVSTTKTNPLKRTIDRLGSHSGGVKPNYKKCLVDTFKPDNSSYESGYLYTSSKKSKNNSYTNSRLPCDLDDFIVEDDGDEGESSEGSGERSSDDDASMGSESESDNSDDSDGETEFEQTIPNKKLQNNPGNHPSRSKAIQTKNKESKPHRKSNILLDSDSESDAGVSSGLDDTEDQDKNYRTPKKDNKCSKATQKKTAKSKTNANSKKTRHSKNYLDEYSEEEFSGSEISGDDVNYEGAELYWRVDAEMDREKELIRSAGRSGRNVFDEDSDASGDSDINELSTPMITKSMSLSEAFMRYIEMLALYHLDPTFNEFMNNTRASGMKRPIGVSSSQSSMSRSQSSTPNKSSKSGEIGSNSKKGKGLHTEIDGNAEGDLSDYYVKLVTNPKGLVHPQSAPDGEPGILYAAYKNPSCHNAYHIATKQIEGVLCTYRESAMGSSAWGYGAFVQSLQSRPFSYGIRNVSHAADSFYKCDACRRSTHKGVRYQVYFYGTGYECKTSWSSGNWPNYMPMGLFIHQSMHIISDTINDSDADANSQIMSSTQTLETKKQRDHSYPVHSDSDSGSDSDSDDPIEQYADALDVLNSSSDRKSLLNLWTPSWLNSNAASVRTKEDEWVMGTKCYCRSGLYHTLLHYKLRLLMTVREKLIKYGYDIKRLMKDTKFIMNELQRYESLIHQAKVFNIKGIVGDERSMNVQEDIWEEHEGVSSPVQKNNANETPQQQMIQSKMDASTSKKTSNTKKSSAGNSTASRKVQKKLPFQKYKNVSNNSISGTSDSSDSECDSMNRSAVNPMDADDIEPDVPDTSSNRSSTNEKYRKSISQQLKQSQLTFNIQNSSNENATNKMKNIVYRSKSKNGKLAAKKF